MVQMIYIGKKNSWQSITVTIAQNSGRLFIYVCCKILQICNMLQYIYSIYCNIFTQYIAIYLLNICNILQYIEWLKRHQAESWCVTTHICDQGFSRGRFQVTWNSWQRAASRWERGQSQTITNCCHWFAQRRVGGVLLCFCVTVLLCVTVSQMGGAC